MAAKKLPAKKPQAKPPAKAASASKLKPLSIVERTFLEHYIACAFNGAEACRRMGIQGDEAGNHRTNPAVRAYEYLQRTHVQAHLELMRAKLPARFPHMIEKAMRTYNDILELDRRELFTPSGQLRPMSELTFAQASAIRKVRYRRSLEGSGDDAELVEYVEVEFESKKQTADAVIDRLSPQSDAPGGNAGQTPATVIINVTGAPLPQSYRVLDPDEPVPPEGQG